MTYQEWKKTNQGTFTQYLQSKYEVKKSVRHKG